jgi:hypothetical protein
LKVSVSGWPDRAFDYSEDLHDAVGQDLAWVRGPDEPRLAFACQVPGVGFSTLSGLVQFSAAPAGMEVLVKEKVRCSSCRRSIGPHWEHTQLEQPVTKSL